MTVSDWIDRLEGLGVGGSMDRKGRRMDNVFIGSLWRSVNYEHIYLKAYGSITDLRKGLKKWFGRYNDWRPHEALGNETTRAVYNNLGDGKPIKKWHEKREEIGGIRMSKFYQQHSTSLRSVSYCGFRKDVQWTNDRVRDPDLQKLIN